MRSKLAKSLAIALATVGLAASSYAAGGTQSDIVQIPFDFKVDTMQMPAGKYRVEQDFGKVYARLVNLNTGRTIQMLRHQPSGRPGEVILKFRATGEARELIRIS